MLKADRSPRLLRDDLSAEEMQSYGSALATLVGTEGWALWQEVITEKREGVLNQLALAPLDQIARLQGYAEAIQHVLDAPRQLLEALESGLREATVKVERPTLNFVPDQSEPAV